MSVELVKAEISRFLANPEPGVLCLRGKWGVGKTYAWNAELSKAAQTERGLAFRTYSKVSLFGLNSLDALKYAVFEHSQKVNGGIRIPSTETLQEYIDDTVAKLPRWRQFLRWATSGSFASRIMSGEGVQALSFMLVRNQMICFDDFERRGDGLSPKDVLGLISFLREERRCKVVLILNDESLDKESRSEFETHLEKVVDVSLVYEPSPELAASIGADGKDEAERVEERCVALGLTNIRTVQRVIRLVETVKPKLVAYDPGVLEAAIGSLTLFCWCRDCPGEAPSLDFIESKTRDTFGLRTDRDEARANADVDSPEPRWRAMLHNYGHTWTNEFDLILMDAVKKGYFDEEKLGAEARKESAKLIKGRREGSFEAAWQKLRDSFADDENESLDGVYQAFLSNVEFITPINLSSTVALFKALGRAEQASEMIARFADARRGEPGLFDLAKNPFRQYVDDVDVRATFEKVAAERREKPDFIALLAGANEEWSSEQIELLAAAPMEEYRKAFKSRSGKELRQLLANALHFADVGGVTEHMREMTRKAQEALTAIAEESPLNALRVKGLGIRAKPPASPTEGNVGQR